jgi:hypothetical protein
MAVAIIDTKEWYTCAEASEFIRKSIGVRVNPDSVRVYCNNEAVGKSPALHGMKMGRDWLIHYDELVRYCEERKPPGRPPADE